MAPILALDRGGGHSQSEPEHRGHVPLPVFSMKWKYTTVFFKKRCMNFGTQMLKYMLSMILKKFHGKGLFEKNHAWISTFLGTNITFHLFCFP